MRESADPIVRAGSRLADRDGQARSQGGKQSGVRPEKGCPDCTFFLTLPGLLELAKTRTPTHLAICEKDRVLPTPRYTRLFTEQLPKNTKVTTLDGVGHVPMYEAPQRIADVITGFVDEYAHPKAG